MDFGTARHHGLLSLRSGCLRVCTLHPQSTNTRAHTHTLTCTHTHVFSHTHTHAHTLPCLPTLHTVRPPCSDHRRCCESPDGCKVWTGAECHRLPHPNCPSPRQCTRLGRKTWRVVRQRGQIFEMMEQADRAHAHTHARTHAHAYTHTRTLTTYIHTRTHAP